MSSKIGVQNIAHTNGTVAATVASDGDITASADLTVSGAFTSQGIDDNADATAITITSAEKVGINNSSPVEMLTIGTTSDSASRIQFLGATNGANTIHFGDGTSADAYRGYINYAHDSDSLQFASAGSERLRITSDGKICVNGTTTGGDMMKINNNGGSGYWALNLNNSGGSDKILISSQSGTGLVTHHQFNNSNGEVGTIKTLNSATNYNTSSDYRLKENVSYDFDATTRLKQLKPARFNFISDETNTLIDGFIAHEVSSIVPQAVMGEKDAVDADGNIDPQGIDQSKLVPLLVKTIQELEARITALEGA